MAPPQKEALRPVRAEEQAALERISRASSERVDRVRRATALLVTISEYIIDEACDTRAARKPA